ncbi:hypothetical protein A5906_23690 [Bradyrhizobium sacchari]|nr:hypothetical protein A5906_23690 [Bradyrhizobium sacchari]
MLRLFVVVEIALNAIDGTMEKVDCRPEQIAQVRLEPRVAQRPDQGVEHIGDRAGDHLALGKGPRIGLVGGWSVAEKLQFGENVVDRRSAGVRSVVIMLGHGWDSFAGSAAPIAAFVAITQTAGGTGQNPKGPERQRRMAKAGYFASRCKARGSNG